MKTRIASTIVSAATIMLGSSLTTITPVLANCPTSPAIAGGGSHTIALKTDGTVWTWGRNSFGELGDGTSSDQPNPTPRQVIGLPTDVVGIAAGGIHSLALMSDGAVWAWGANGSTELGDGTTTSRPIPVQVVGITNVVAIAAGGNWWQDDRSYCCPPPVNTRVGGFTVALKADGTVWTWGDNQLGELGNGTTSDRATPGQVPGLNNVVAIAAGGAYAGAVRSDGTVWMWGWNLHGQLGDGTTTLRPAPVQVIGLSSVVAVNLGGNHSLALKSDGTVWAWGINCCGQLGDGTTSEQHAPVQVVGLSNVVAIAAGGRQDDSCNEEGHSIALKSDGTMWAWGLNNNGQLGDGTTTCRSVPVQVKTGVIELDAGWHHTVAIVGTNGQVWTWGANYVGQLGDGTTTYRSNPVQVVGLQLGTTTNGPGDTPAVTCPGDIVVTNDSGQCSAVVNYTATASDPCSGIASLTEDFPSGSTFPSGTTTVTVTAVNGAGNSNSCSFTITVVDAEAPRLACRPAPNPSGKISVPGKNGATGVNPNGYYQLLAKDDCDPDPAIYVKDTGSSFVAGPFKDGDIIRIKHTGGTVSSAPGSAPVVAVISLNGNGLAIAEDASGNVTPDASGCLMQ